ncbi:hydrolase [Flavobacterium sp. NST-5]|uniref:Hydrolase n=1 Tax=Flavobacterium ichthyis TaxID=2698827 RepID=A0ABW9Z5W7_9FLAO|nr:DUF5916 domain-containing protein [Flavobacterium ichthyis]NBL63641.1 hydrolase [Flavobacterium ichthyis]
MTKPLTLFLLVFFNLILTNTHAQKKSLNAIRKTENISIDGKMDELEWNSAPVANGFVMFEPDNGKVISDERSTEVRVLYDNEAIYVSAILRDEQPGNILSELTERDNFGTADHFGVFINGFNDGQQDFRFFVSSSGVQMDCLATEGNEDYSWDAIWDSEVSKTEYGWYVEMKIPYAALRFSNENVQNWGLNFYREIKRDRQKYHWNHVDLNVGNTMQQTGQLTGIENIKPPTRLFFIPYSSYYLESNEAGTDNTFKVGMDVKYGINDSFTLDAILVPDFGQTKFDDVVLNLGPFEQQFNENRPFFTEGTDLFNKGELFYSRRIGGTPSTYLNGNELTQVENPATVNLINAVKVSGRTSSGLGIGVLNAITEKTYGTSTNLETGERRKVLVEPFANYNIMVLDQRFNQNSSVSFINTSVLREGEFRDANVSAILYNLNTKNNRYFVTGDFKYSHVNEFGEAENKNGYFTSIQLGKKGGMWRYNAGANYVSKQYDINDLGLIFITNYHSFYGNYNYRILSPTKLFNTFRINANIYNEIENITGKSQQAQLNFDLTSTTVKNDYIGASLYFNPFKTFDFYEPRVEGRFLEMPKRIYAEIYFSSNYNRKFALDVRPYATFTSEEKRNYYGIIVSPRYRFSDQLLATISTEVERQTNDIGWVDFADDDIIMGKRDRNTVINTLALKYAINPKMTINVAARHYWSYAEYNEYLTLQQNGSLLVNPNFTENMDSDFSTWNFDLSYSWWFAPGSQLSVLYRNNATDYRNDINKELGNNFRNLFQNNLNNIFSLSIRYFIDYNSIKNKF